MIWLGAGIALGLGVVRQCRKPSGWLGRLFAFEMNVRHRALTAWGLSHATPGPNSVVLDVGCGGGRTVRELAQIAREGKVYGIDYAGASVAVARMVNAAAIGAGQVEVLQGSVSALPFAADMFDLVTAVETHLDPFTSGRKNGGTRVDERAPLFLGVFDWNDAEDDKLLAAWARGEE